MPIRSDWLAPFIAFGISIAFWPGLAGAATSPRWAIAALSLWFLDWRCLPFVALCFALLSFDAAVHWTIVCAAFCWGLNGNYEIRRVVGAFSLGMGFSGAVAIAQSFGWSGIPQAIAPAGFFVNKNFLGEAACLALIAMATLTPSPKNRSEAITKFTIMGLLALAIILSTSRASWLATVIALLWALPSLRWRILAFGAVLCMGGILWSTGFLDSITLMQRLALWQDAMQHLSWFGNGSYDYSTVTYRDPHLHNDWLQLIYELGLFGLMPLAAILPACWNPQAIPFVMAFLIIGTFGFPLQMPATAWFSAFIIGHSVGRIIIERRMVLRSRAISPQYA